MYLGTEFSLGTKKFPILGHLHLTCSSEFIVKWFLGGKGGMEPWCYPVIGLPKANNIIYEFQGPYSSSQQIQAVQGNNLISWGQS